MVLTVIRGSATALNVEIDAWRISSRPASQPTIEMTTASTTVAELEAPLADAQCA
jgi:hypothetical protein